MIGSIRGRIISQTDKFLIIEAGGVGYKIYVSPDTLSKTANKKDEVFLWVHSHVREEVFDLYGFLDQENLEFFQMLLNVSGIGPRSALVVLGVATIETLRKAIGTGDTAYLTKISGIGRKTAEKIVLELHDKIAEMTKDEKSGSSLREELDVLEALKSLGYSQNEARDALKKVSPDGSTNAKIKEALKILGGR